MAALGPLADAVVYDDGDRALADAPEGDGAILAIASRRTGAARASPGSGSCSSAVEAEPAARGIASTVLRDVYLADTVAEAAEKQRQHPRASFVTPEGVLVGPAVIHTAREADARAREIRAELQVVAHDLSATLNALNAPPGPGSTRSAGRSTSCGEQIEAADAEITAVAERLAGLERDLTGMRKEEELLAQRLGALDETVAVCAGAAGGDRAGRGRADARPPAQPAAAGLRRAWRWRRSVATDRRTTRGSTGCGAERDELAAHDPVALRAELEAAEVRP